MNPLSKRALWHFIKALTFHPILLLRFFRLQKNALTWYCLPQFIPGYVPKVVTLDTELDDLIPFNPGYFSCYLDFANLWMGSLGCLYEIFGRRALPEMIQFIDGLESLFSNSKKVFDSFGSTVTRPRLRLDFRSLIIHITDRNLYCLPSLHVMIVCYNLESITQILGRLRVNKIQSAEIAILEEKALQIIESVIHVKQHSLIDIPAGLFLLTAMGKGLGQKRDQELLGRLFDGNSAAPRIRIFLKIAYLNFIQDWDEKQDPSAILLRFLGNYSEESQKLVRNTNTILLRDV